MAFQNLPGWCHQFTDDIMLALCSTLYSDVGVTLIFSDSVTCIMVSKAPKTTTRQKELMQATVWRPRDLEEREYRKTRIWTGVSLQASNEELGYAGEPWGMGKWELGARSQGYTEGQPAPVVPASPGLQDHHGICKVEKSLILS